MIHTEQVAGLAAFTYFKDTDGFIYYASGDNSLESDTVRSVLVYAPANDGAAARYQPSSETAYAKMVSHGYRSELPRLRDGLPPEQYRIVAAMFERDEDSGDELLAVPTSRITEVYDPKRALIELLDGANPSYSDVATAKAREAIDAFEGRGVHLGRIGLYGGLQCSLVHTDGKEINDIDLLVDGLDAYADVVSLAASNVVRPETFPAFIANHAIRRAVALRRGQLSQFRLSQNPDTVVDVRLVRDAQDSYEASTLLTGTQLGDTMSVTGATVVDAQESLSVPARFTVQDVKGKVWSIATNQYDHLGAATEGDIVAVHGRMSGQDAIVLTDPDRHHIYMPALA